MSLSERRWQRRVMGADMKASFSNELAFTPIAREAAAIVEVNGRDYAGFASVAEADEAVRLWRLHWQSSDAFPRRFAVRARGLSVVR